MSGHAKDRIVWLLGAASLFAALGAGPAFGVEPFADYFAGLRGRGLYRLAEQYGLRRLTEERLNVAVRSLIAVELSRTFAAHALAEGGPGPDEEDLWKRAEEVLKPALEAEGNPRRMEAVVQLAMLPIDRGLALSWRHLLFPDDAAVQTATESSLRKGIRELTAARGELEEAIRADRPVASRISDGAISPLEYRRLSERAAYQLAVAHVELGRVLPAGGAQTEVLREGMKQLELLAKARGSTSYEARLQRVAAARLLGDLALATTLVNDLANDELSPAERDRVLAERIRILVGQGQYPDAIARVVEARKGGTGTSDEVGAALVDAYLATWGLARQKQNRGLADDLWKQLQTEQSALAGPWRTYADLRVDQAGDVLKYGEALAGRIRTARVAYQAGEIDRAVEEFGKAIGDAMDQGQTEAAIEIASTRGSVLLNAGRYEAAAEAFRQIVERFADHPLAPDASLLGAYASARLAEESPTAAHRDALIAALTAHLERYGRHATATEAQWMLGLARERQRNWTEAIRLYGAIPADSPHGSEAQSRLALAHVERWREARRSGMGLAQAEAEAVEALTRLTGSFPAPPAGWTVLQSDVALKLALIELTRTEPAAEAADRILQRIQESRDLAMREARRDEVALHPEWERIGREVSQLRILSLARRERFDEARQVLAALTGTSPAELLGVLNGLTDLADGFPPGPRRELGQLQLETARRLQTRRGELDPPRQRQLDQCLAQAYIATGNIPEAVTIYEAMLKQETLDKNLIRTVADLLTRRGQPSDLEKAKVWWQKLESLERKGSREWLDARLLMGENLLALGRPEECRKMVRVTRILYPELGGEEVRKRFEDLERRAASPGSR